MIKPLGLDYPSVADVDADVGRAAKQQHADEVGQRLNCALGVAALLESADVDILSGGILGRTCGRIAPEVALNEAAAVMHALTDVLGPRRRRTRAAELAGVLRHLGLEQRLRCDLTKGAVPIGIADLCRGVGHEAGISLSCHDDPPNIM